MSDTTLPFSPKHRCVSVVIPCFNEVDGVSKLSETLRAFAKAHEDEFMFEFILVDDGSTDATWEVLAEHFEGWELARMIRHPENQGLMAAVMTGIRAASYEIVCSMDSDCTYHPDGIADLVDALEQPGVMAATGSPYHPMGTIKNVPAWRIWLSQIASHLYSYILRNRLYCYTSCFRAYRKSFVENVKLDHNGYVGTVEILWKMETETGGEIAEIPSTLSLRQYGQSKCRVVQVAFGHLVFMSRIIRARLFAGFNFSPPATHTQQNRLSP